jgi:(S)-3,5-dihydroxyphenylglycine transaminase
VLLQAVSPRYAVPVFAVRGGLDRCPGRAGSARLPVAAGGRGQGFGFEDFDVTRVPAALARSAQDFGVIWTPMSYFYPHGGGDNSIRLSVSYLTHEEITEGISRLAEFIEAGIYRG